MPSSRRQFLAALGTAGVGSLAGCTGDILSSGDAADSTRCPAYEAPKWTISGREWSPPVVHDGQVLASTHFSTTGDTVRSRLVAASRVDGQERWIETVEGGGFGVPRADDGTVFVGTATDLVLALDDETGDRRWTYDAGGREEYGGGAPGQPAVVGDTVVVGISHSRMADADPSDPGDYTHRVVGLDRETGAERWATAVDGHVWSGPTRIDDAADGGTDVVVATESGSVVRLDAATGEVEWRASLDAGFRRPVLVTDDSLVVATVEGTVRAVDPATGDRGWLGALPAEPTDWTQTDEGIVVGDATGAVTAFRPDRDGKQQWQYEATPVDSDDTESDEATRVSDAAIAGVDSRDGVVYAFDQQGIVHAVSAANGSRLWRRRHAEGVADGCGWAGDFRRANALTADEDFCYLAGPWLGAVPRDSTE